MPFPSEATVKSAIGLALITDSEAFAKIAVTATSFVTRHAAFVDAVPSNSSPAAQQAAMAQRAALNAALDPGVCAAKIAPLIVDYLNAVGVMPEAGESPFRRLFRYMGDTTKSVLSRGFTFGTISAITGTGTGLVKRLTVDEYGFVIESGFAEAKRFECIADSHSGTERHSELFEVRGARAGPDGLERLGTGRVERITCISAKSTEQFVRNPSFEAVADTSSFAANTDLTGWTMDSYSNFAPVAGVSSSTFYKDVPGATTPRSLRFTGNGYIYQRFADRRVKWDPNIPLYAQIAFYRESSCDGDLTLTIGDKSTTVALSAQSGWTILTFAITTDAWFKQWNTTDVSSSLANFVKIALSSRTTGTLLIDDFLLGQYSPVDGAWVAIVGGATPFLRGDYFTVTDTSTDTGIIQTQLARCGLGYLPHLSSSNTWSEPT